jgi:hypothetical protein
MILCSEGHDEICYEGRSCPACELKDNLQYQIDEMQKIIDRQQIELEKMENI